MIYSVKQAHEEFYRKFWGISVQVKGEEVKVPLTYARQSSYDYSEASPNQSYPCIAVYDYPPVLKDNWYVDTRPFFSGADIHDSTIGYLEHRPVWLEFRYDVSIACLGYSEYLALQDYFTRNFLSEVRFLYNKKGEGYDEVGDVVPYKVSATDISRTDGVYETNYEFVLSVWVHSKDSQVVDLIQKVAVEATPKQI